MKYKKSGIKVAVFGIVVCLTAVMFLSADAFADAKISFMAGKVTVVRKGRAMKAKFQMKLRSGDLVKTGKSAFADVSYDDGSIIKVKENSSVKIGNNNLPGSDSLSVNSGIISAKFAKLKKDSTRKVYTPTTVCAIRGTEFEVAVSDSADSNVQLSEGALQLLNPYGVTNIKENQNAEIKVSQAPQKAEGGDLNQWKEQKENELEANPDEKADAFSQYVKDFQERSKDASKDINDLERKKNSAVIGGKNKLEKANEDIAKVEGNVEDDLYLNSAANNSINGILSRFKKDKKDMYDVFLKIKKESNKVLEQQKRNAEAIAAVKAAYKKAYDSIMKKHQDALDRIKGSYNKDSVKPKK